METDLDEVLEYSNVFLSAPPRSGSMPNYDIGASGRPSSRQTHIDSHRPPCRSLSARVSVARASRGAQIMPGEPLVLQGIRTDHTNQSPRRPYERSM